MVFIKISMLKRNIHLDPGCPYDLLVSAKNHSKVVLLGQLKTAFSMSAGRRVKTRLGGNSLVLIGVPD